MSLSFFSNKLTSPSENEVSEALGETAIYWEGLRLYLQTYGFVREEWKLYSQKSGWCKKLLLVSGEEERNIVFLYPNANYFTNVLVFGEKAVSAAVNSRMREDIVDKITAAKPYKEGRSFNIEIRGESDFEIIKKLIEIKIKNY